MPKAKTTTTEIAVIPPVQVEQFKGKAEDLDSQVRQLKVNGQPGLEFAARLINTASDIKKEILKLTEPAKKAAHAAWKGVCKLEADLIAPADKSIAAIKAKVDGYLAEQEQLRLQAEEEERKRQEAYQAKLEKAKKPERVKPPEEVYIPPVPKVAGIAVVERWYFKIDDPQLVPKEFWIIDESAINAVVQKQKKDAVIPGVSIWSESKSQRS